jgi:hypothetical protein
VAGGGERLRVLRDEGWKLWTGWTAGLVLVKADGGAKRVGEVHNDFIGSAVLTEVKLISDMNKER